MNHARDLYRAVGDFADALARALDRTRALDRIRARDLDLVLDLDSLNRVRALALHLYRDLDRDLDLDRAVVRDLVRDLGRDRVRARDRVPDLTLDRDLVRDLAHDLDLAWRMANRLHDLMEASRRSQNPPAVALVRPAAAAVRLTHRVARVLPAGSRGRYDDEFGSELYELAAAGASRWAQLVYAVRLLDRAWVLRAELREATARRVRS